MEKFKWIQSVNTYLYIVERINEHFNKMRRTMEHEMIEEEAFYLCVELLRMFPFKINIENDKLQLIEEDGICLLKKDIEFLMDDLDKILQKNDEVFKKIKSIRNKYEHEPHNVNSAFSTSSGAYAGIGFYCRKKLISINTMELTYIIYDLNKLMDKIQQFVYKVEEVNQNCFDSFTKEYVELIKKRKNVEYNSSYVRIPRWIDLK